MPSSAGVLNYPIHAVTLANGLRVIVSPDHGTPVVAVNLWYNVGSRDEPIGSTGFAHLFEHVMFQGSAHVASGEHLARLQANGATCNATTWFDRTNYFESVPTGALDLALWLEADRMATLSGALTQENLDTQRDVVKEEKRQRYDNVPYGDVVEHLVRLSFPADHPYGHTTIGSMADLDAATVDSAARFFDTWYHPGNCVLTLAGDIEPREAFAKAKRYFGALPAAPGPERTPWEPLPPHSGVPRAQASAPVPAEALYVTWRLPARGTRDYDCCEIALDVLGGGQSSRLYRRLVHHDQVASGAGASAMGLIAGTSLGFVYARSLDDTPLARLERAVGEELDRLIGDGVTAEELARTGVQFEREWLSQLAHLDSRADLLSAYETLHGDAGRVNRRIAEYSSITADEVQDAARRFLRPDQRAVFSYFRGPLGGEAPSAEPEGPTA